MRIRAAATVLSGAVVLSALVLPSAAQAAEHPGAATDLLAFASPSVEPRDALGGTTFSDGVVNAGKDIVLGVTGKKAVPVTFTAFDVEGVAITQAFLWQGTDSSSTDTITGGLESDDYPTCTETPVDGGYSYSCKTVFTIDPAVAFKDGNGTAGTWKVFLGAYDLYANASYDDDVTRTKIKRASKLTANASPEPVKKGKTITVTGKLSRANWTTGKYAGYAAQPVQLQFRKKGSSTYTTLKTVKTSSTGTLSTTTKAGTDGYYRFAFAGTTTTGTAKATGDFVDVK
ncbi:MULTISPECIES: hypothetical protein [unclassified Streptomyces]|uniref:hypothetical protein n=1 Tax=unclassified Streptomyces TaxID=2593676 RepID=UPI0036ED76ED